VFARVVFGLLVLATFTAFFVAQRLKRTEPLVYAVQMGKFVSPNDDGRRERVSLRFRTKKQDVATIQVIGRDGRSVRTLAFKRPLRSGSHLFRWDGRDASRDPVADGPYSVRITLRGAGRSFVPDKTFRVDTVAPRVRVAAAVPHEVPVAGPRRPVRVRYSGPAPVNRAEFVVYRVRGDRASRRPVAAFAGSRTTRRGYWNIKVGRFVVRKSPCFGPLVSRGRARPAPAGQYVIAVRACDSAGNLATGPPQLPPRKSSITGRGGVAVRGLELAPGMLALRPGEIASVPMFSPWRDVRWRLRAQDGEVVKRGRAARSRVRFRAPDVAPGLYLLSAAAAEGGAGRVAQTPVVVRGSRRSKLLLVEPAIAWQGENPVDVNGDGFADVLSDDVTGKPLRLPTYRPLAGGKLPRGLRTNEGAITELAATLATPDVTTDFALGLDPDRWLRGRQAVVLAGDSRWQSPAAGIALRRFVERGGSVVLFELESLHRTVRVNGRQITGPSPRAERDVFGERTQVARYAPAPVVPFSDPLGIFTGPTGLFTRFEEARGLAEGAERIVSAGRDQQRPAVEVYRLGKGKVIRVGADGWSAQVAAGIPAVSQVTANLIEEALR
jgi:hypothetical protein